MSVKTFFDKTVTVRRLRTSSGYKKSYQCTATADCHIQDLDARARQQMGIVDARAWVGYFSADDDYVPNVGDHITDSDGHLYKVTDVTKKNYSFGINQHVEVVMVEFNE